jgi:hypothetical protein
MNKSLELGVIVAGVAVAGYVVYEFIIPKDEGTLVLSVEDLPVMDDLGLLDDATYCTVDGRQVATSLLVQTGLRLRAGVHTFAMHVDEEGDGQYMLKVQSQFHIQSHVRTRLHLRSDYGTEETYEDEELEAAP